VIIHFPYEDETIAAWDRQGRKLELSIK
jgi:hypothetical protein